MAQPAVRFTRPPGPAIEPYAPASADALHLQPVFSTSAVADMVVPMDDEARAHPSRQLVERRNTLWMA
jgi:hypothetical protein